MRLSFESREALEARVAVFRADPEWLEVGESTFERVCGCDGDEAGSLARLYVRLPRGFVTDSKHPVYWFVRRARLADFAGEV